MSIHFCTLFKLAWNCCIDFNVVQSGFKRSGIYLFNRNAVTTARHNLLSSNSLVEKMPIDFLFQVPSADSMLLAYIFTHLSDICFMCSGK